MCRVLCLSESGYYRWLRNREKRNRRQLLAVKIDAILAEHPDNRNYGVDRVCLALEQDGVDVSRRTVYRVMKENRYIFIYYNRVRVYTRNPLGLPPVKYREWMRAQQAA